MRDHLTEDDKDMLDMLHSVVANAASQKISMQSWELYSYEREIRDALRDVLIDLTQANLRERELAPQLPTKQEPVAWYYEGSTVEPQSVALDCDLFDTEKANCTPLYTAPQKHEWQGLTEAELSDTYESEQQGRWGDHIRSLLAIEDRLKEKNT